MYYFFFLYSLFQKESDELANIINKKGFDPSFCKISLKECSLSLPKQ
jgi:hypothetical protein